MSVSNVFTNLYTGETLGGVTVIDGRNFATEYALTNGRVTTMMKEGAVWRMDYDACGVLTSLVGPRPARLPHRRRRRRDVTVPESQGRAAAARRRPNPRPRRSGSRR